MMLLSSKQMKATFMALPTFLIFQDTRGSHKSTLQKDIYAAWNKVYAAVFV